VDAYSATPAPSNSYRATAFAIRALLPTLQSPEVRGELRLLAAYYERLAGYVDATLEVDSAHHDQTENDWPFGPGSLT
jgi:hypothetical protein